MKAKKLLTMVTFLISVISLIAVLLIGKKSNSINYDISLAMFGSAVLGFIMSITEYWTERRRAMEDFFIQATRVLNVLRKIKKCLIHEPIDLVIDSINEKYDNDFVASVKGISIDLSDVAKNNMINYWIDHSKLKDCMYNEEVLDEIYNKVIIEYIDMYKKCMKSYIEVSSVDLYELDNAYGNMDFIFKNITIREDAYKLIYSRLRECSHEIKQEANFFKVINDDSEINSICIKKINEMDRKFYALVGGNNKKCENQQYVQKVFDEIDLQLDVFRKEIYNNKNIFSMRFITKWITKKKESIMEYIKNLFDKLNNKVKTLLKL